jgi:WD40 repeat protein
LTAVAFGQLPDGRTLLATASEDTVRLWDPATGRPASHPLTGHTNPVMAVAFGQLPDGRSLLATASYDETVRLWDPATGQPASDRRFPWRRWRRARLLTGHTSGVTALAFGRLPDGRTLLATASEDTVKLWDPATGRSTGHPLTHANAVTAVAFGRLPDGRTLLATASYDQTVRLWDPATGQPAGHPITGHTGAVRAVVFGRLPDGRTLLATASWDQTVRLWEIGSDLHIRQLYVFPLAPSTPLALAFASVALYVGCSDGVIALKLPVFDIESTNRGE